MTDPARAADFFDRDHERLRCRECGYVFAIPSDWIGRHPGEHLPCPGCGLTSRLPTEEESEWPQRKDPGDPVDGASMVER